MLLNTKLIVTPILLIWCVKEICGKTFRGFGRSCNDDTSECLKEFAQSMLPAFLEGIPELEIPPLDPFVFEKVQLKLPGGLRIEFTDGQSTGFKKCIVESVRNNENAYEVILHCNLTMEGKYKSVGRLLMFPVNGEGDSKITCSNIKITINFGVISKIYADGREHVELENFNSKHTFEGQVQYHLTNIFKGNPSLSKVVLDFMNSNWRMVAQEFGDPIVNYGIDVILDNFRKLLQIVPADELVIR